MGLEWVAGPCDHCGRPAPGLRTYWGERLCGACGAETAEGFELEGWPAAPWDAPAPRSTLILGPGYCLVDGCDKPAKLETFGELAALAEREGAGEVFVHETALPALGWPLELGRRETRAGEPHPFFAELEGFETSLSPAGLAPWANYWRPAGFGFRLFVPHYGRRLRAEGSWGPAPPFAGLESPWALSWALGAYQAATRGRWPWRGTGARTSDAWLASRYRRGRLKPTAIAPPYAQELAAEADMQWARAPRGPELKARYLLAFDVNGAYLGAAGGVSLPAGELEHVTGFEVLERVPGYWRFEAPEWQGPGPAPWWRPAGTEGPLWVTTPAAAYLAGTFGLEPLEAWVWPEHHGYLRPWYEDLREARLEAKGPALEAVKAIYKAGLGKLASKRWHPKGAADPLYQPYWDQAVTALARCNLHRRIAGLELEPVGVAVDCLYFLTNSPSHGAFAARAGIPLGEGLGQFKPKGRRLEGRVARAELERGRGPVATWQALDEMAAA